MFPAQIVGILRFFFGVRRRCACDVSTMDTSDLPDLFPPRIAAFRTTNLPPGSRPNERLRSHDTHMSHK